MTKKTEVVGRAQFGAATVIGILVPVVAATAQPSDELAIALCFAIVVAARLIRIDFRLPLIPGLVLLPFAAIVQITGIRSTAREIATAAAALVIMAVVLALSMQAESRDVLRTWWLSIRDHGKRKSPIFVLVAAVLLLGSVVALATAFVLLDASLFAALVASAVALAAHSFGKSPATALYLPPWWVDRNPQAAHPQSAWNLLPLLSPKWISPHQKLLALDPKHTFRANKQ